MFRMAVLNGDVTAVRLHLRRGADPNATASRDAVVDEEHEISRGHRPSASFPGQFSTSTDGQFSTSANSSMAKNAFPPRRRIGQLVLQDTIAGTTGKPS